MGRKIPAKKHHGVKDPLVQQARRLRSLKGKINAPPTDPDDQPVPKSLIRLFNLQDKNNKSKEQKTKHKPQQSQTNNGREGKGGANPLCRMQRLAGESGRSFSLRINSALRSLNEPAEQMDYPTHEMEAEDLKGEYMEERRRKRQKRRQQKAGGGTSGTSGANGTGGASGDKAVSRVQRLSLKKQAKRQEQEKQRAVSAREVQHERVRFGDVAHAPPALRAPPGIKRKLAARGDKPGARALLLRDLLPAERERRQRARDDAVAAYRMLKRKRD